MSVIASQITSLTIVYSTVYSRRRLKKTSKLRVIGLCVGNSPVAGEFPAQRASNAENVSILWRHHELCAWFMVRVLLWFVVVWYGSISDKRICVSEEGIVGRDKQLNPTGPVGCNYLSLSLIPVYGAHLPIYPSLALLQCDITNVAHVVWAVLYNSLCLTSAAHPKGGAD